MDILLITATEAEIAPLKEAISKGWEAAGEDIFKKNGLRLHIYTCGVGAPATIYNLTKKLLTGEKYDLVIQGGIGGSYNRNMTIGDVVAVATERFGDLGAEDHDNYLDIFDMGLIKPDEKPFSEGWLPAHEKILAKTGLLKVKGLTVNTVSGNVETVKKLEQRYNCDIESMEGAAFHYVCLQEKVPFVQLRAISNYVEARDKSKWNIPLAVRNLNIFLPEFIERLQAGDFGE